MVFEKVVALLAEYKEMEAGAITPETTFAELELDSLDRVELIMNIEEAFKVQIDMEQSLERVGDVVAVIEKQLPGGAA